MIITNFDIRFEPHQTSKTERTNCAIIGESYQGSRTFSLSVPHRSGKFLKAGARQDLSIGDQDDTGAWRISKADSSHITLLLTSRPSDADTKDFSSNPPRGRILAPVGQKLHVRDFSRSARRLSDARWNEVLMDVQPGDIFVIDIVGGRQPHSSFYLIDCQDLIKVKRDIVNESYRGLLASLYLPYDRKAGGILSRSWCNVLKPSETFPLPFRRTPVELTVPLASTTKL